MRYQLGTYLIFILISDFIKFTFGPTCIHKYLNNLHCARFHTGSSNQERHPDVELEGEAFAFHQPKLPEVIPVVRRVHKVRVV